MRPSTPRGTRSTTTTRTSRGCSTSIAATASMAPPGARPSATRARTGASTCPSMKPSGSTTGPRWAPGSRSTTDLSPAADEGPVRNVPDGALVGLLRGCPVPALARSPLAAGDSAAGLAGDHQLRAPALARGPDHRAQLAVAIERGDQLLGPRLLVRATRRSLRGRRHRGAGIAGAGDLLPVAEVGGGGAVHLDRGHHLAGDVPQAQQGQVDVIALAACGHVHGLFDRERTHFCAPQLGQVPAEIGRSHG